jgi:glycosyltransferase involved in cell wall biosynthesis
MQEGFFDVDSRKVEIDTSNAALVDTLVAAKDLIGRLAGVLEGSDAEATALLRDAHDALGRLALSETGTLIPAVPRQEDGPRLVLDISDLVGYFETNRLPTGIQRVQAELILNVVNMTHGLAAGLCCFVAARDQWVAVDSAMFLEICAMSRAGGDAQEPRWLTATGRMRAVISGGPKLIFSRGAVLVNVGASWWLPNYFLHVRQAKIASGVRYVPLIYDLIPVVTPENCDLVLVEEFIGWFIGVLEHADYYLAISDATRNDLMAFAAKLGRPIAPDRITVARLDADFRSAEVRALPLKSRFDEPFVLLVSTLEARKNQMGALDAWARLIAKHGADRIPRLVLVGKLGFKSDMILSRLDANADLRERVTVLSGIEDVELHALYRDCLFTIYPSLYEGWGLPITESLCHGKVPLTADNSSLPEAGGSFALYFKTGSMAGMIAMLERLILKSDLRKRQEQTIRDGFRPRPWAEITCKIVEQIQQWTAIPPVEEWQFPLAEAEAYYPLTRNRSTRVWRGMGSAEAFRQGVGWYRVEDMGCWTRPAGAELQLRLPDSGAHRLGLELICPPGNELRYKVEIADHQISVRGRIQGDHHIKWVFLDLPSRLAGTAVTMHLSTTILSSLRPSDSPPLGIGLRGFFIFNDNMASRINFIEAVALGALGDLDFYRERLSVF